MKGPNQIKLGISFFPTLQYSSTPKEFAPVPAKPLNPGLTPRTKLSMLNIASSALASETFLTRLLFHQGVSDLE